MSEAASQEPVQIVVCVDSKGAIGKEGRLLYRISEDMARFKRITTDTVLVMGRKTYDSLPKVLPNRHHIVITRDPNNVHIRERDRGQVDTAYSLNDAIAKARQIPARGISIIGGGEIYRMALDMKVVNTIQSTEVMEVYEDADTFFPKVYLNEPEKMEFKTVQQDLLERKDPRTGTLFRFQTLHRIGYGQAIEKGKFVEDCNKFCVIKQQNNGKLRIRKKAVLAYGQAGEYLINIMMKDQQDISIRCSSKEERAETIEQLDAVFLAAVF